MEDGYEIGDFGHAVFKAVKKDFTVDTDCYGTIQMMDKKYVWFADNNGTPCLIEKNKFKFEKMVFKVIGEK
jgi:hypothetical protein